MDLKKWREEEFRRANETLQICVKRWKRGEEIDLLEHLIPEFKNLNGKNYTLWVPPGSPEVAEECPSSNLGILLNSSLYEHVIVPINETPDKATFLYRYGLSENRGCGISFDQFLNLIRAGTLKPYLTAPPTVYSPRFYKDIFRACEQQREGCLPPLTRFRVVTGLLGRLKFFTLVLIDRIKPPEHLVDFIERKHPEYYLPKCVEEIAENCSQKSLEDLGKQTGNTYDMTCNTLGTMIHSLRIMGLEGLAQVSLTCLRLNSYLGFRVLDTYDSYLVGPVSDGLLGFTNYGKRDVDRMSFLKLIPGDLSSVWKELLSSSPAASSVGSPQVDLNTVELRGDDLIRFVEAHPETELKSNVKGISTSLAKFDVPNAMKHFQRVDEIVTERYNKEIHALTMKTRVTSHALRFGKSFLNRAASLGAGFLATAMVAVGQFQWLPTIFAGAVGAKYAEAKLSEINAEDIVKWWSNIWPFSDPGLPFVLWEHSFSKKTRQN